MNEIALVKAHELYQFLTNKLAVHRLDESEQLLRGQLTRALQKHYKFMETCLDEAMKGKGTDDPESPEGMLTQ